MTLAENQPYMTDRSEKETILIKKYTKTLSD